MPIPDRTSAFRAVSVQASPLLGTRPPEPPPPATQSAPSRASQRKVGAKRDALLALHDAQEEIVAGLANARLVVRTLDRVSCEVYAGELLVVSGGVASGARSLMGALDGTRTLSCTRRDVANNVRLRRALVAPECADAIVAGWRDTTVRNGPDSIAAQDRVRTVYLLRVRQTGSPSAYQFTLSAWRRWSSQVRARGGAVVLCRHDAGSSVGASAFDNLTDRGDDHTNADASHHSHDQSTRTNYIDSAMVREPTVREDTVYEDSLCEDVGRHNAVRHNHVRRDPRRDHGVRMVVMRAGQIIAADSTANPS